MSTSNPKTQPPELDLDRGQVYLVGGAVRDELLGLPVKDRDWVLVGGTPNQLLDLGFKQVGADFPCFLHPQTHEEYALARTERKSGHGYQGFSCDFGPDISLEQDLQRRDLTINAIAKAGDKYIDPYGGLDDLKSKRLRHVSNAFVEDPLRVLRVARFAARYKNKGFDIAPETMALMSDLAASGELEQLTPERVWKELVRALVEEVPSEFFRVLRRCGALKIMMPELDSLFGIPQPPKYHPEVDTGEHVMMALDVAKSRFSDPIVAWAVLVHDLGKGLTPASEWPRHTHHEIRGVPLARALADRYRVPKVFRDIGMLVAEHHLRSHQLMTMQPGSVYRLLEALDGLRRPARVAPFIQACEADACGRGGLQQNAYPQGEFLLSALEIARHADIKPVLKRGLKGEELAAGIRECRIKTLAASGLMSKRT